MSFRYYLYISDSKVDMLLPQIDPGFGRTRETELSVNIPLAGGKRRTVETGSERVTRLERVVRYLEDHGDVGTVDEPGQFFWGILPMLTAELGDQLAYFSGRTDKTILVLGGSTKHLTSGSTPADVPVLSGSYGPTMIRSMLDLIKSDESGEDSAEGDDWALSVVYSAMAGLRGPRQNVEFLAKRLVHGPSPYPERDSDPDTMVLLGSPLYVALVD